MPPPEMLILPPLAAYAPKAKSPEVETFVLVAAIVPEGIAQAATRA
jgi:hypothetical protein